MPMETRARQKPGLKSGYPKILLTGTYCAANKGNAAITLGAIKSLRQVFPGARISLLTPFPKIDTPVYDGVRIVPCSRRSPKIFLLAARATAKRLLGKSHGPPTARISMVSEFYEYASADLILDISGDAISENYGFLVGLSHLMPLLIGAILGRKTVIFGQSLGPFRYLTPLVRFVLNRTRLITLRERLSGKLLDPLHLTGPRVELTFDPAFLMEGSRDDRLRQLLQRENLLKGSGPFLGVNASTLIGQKVTGMKPGSAMQTYIEKMTLACNRWIETLGCTVVFVPHVTGPDQARDERHLVSELYQRISDRRRARAILRDYAAQDLKGIVASMDLFVGVRMHSNIAALSSGVPVVSLAYSHKASGIMAMLGQDRWVLDINTFSAEDLIQTVAAAWAVRHSTRRVLQAMLPIARLEALRNALLAKELLEEE